MSRCRRGFKARRRRNKILKLAKGFHFDRRTMYRHAVQTVLRAMHYAYKSRKLFKRDQRRLWTVRLNAAARQMGFSYSQLIHQLSQKNIHLNRKMLSEIAATDPQGFQTVVKHCFPS